MADILMLNAINKLNKTMESSCNGSIVFQRPTHYNNKCSIAGTSGSFTVPATATKIVIEMWGQGGNTGGSCCCMSGAFGGQGGAYASKIIDMTGCAVAQTFCGCTCINSDCTSNGTPGAFSRLTNCNTGVSYCVTGGAGGCSQCWFGQSNSCVCNTQYALPSCNTMTSSVRGLRTNSNIAVDPTMWTSSTTTQSSADLYFQPISCACFDTYRLGSCGWGTAYACCTGVGGASYAGGNEQRSNGNPGYPACCYFCGSPGNFPGGGASASAAYGGGCCYGAQGAPGLILVSWN